MRLNYLDERPSALPDTGAPAHVHRVGHLTVIGVSATVLGASAGWRSQQEQSVMFIQQLTQQTQRKTQQTQQKTQQTQQKSVQLQEPKVRIQGINGRTAKATGMVEAPFSGVDTSGVPPRGRPV